MRRTEEQEKLLRFWERLHPSESQVATAWEQRAFKSDALHTVDGQTLQVVFPGRGSGLRGPDFKDALLVIDGCLQKGSVEIHVRSSDFNRHGHSSDHHYDGLILHVVLMHDTEELKLNEKVPVLELGRLLEGLPDIGSRAFNEASLPCVNAVEQMGLKRLVHHLEEAGEARFKIKAGRFLGDICYFGEEETIYQGVMEALGYSQNKEPFLALARSVPSELFRTISGLPSKEMRYHVQRLFLWASFLESDCEEPEEAQKYGIIQLKPGAWELSRIRPDNHPLTRISGVSSLITTAYRQYEGLEQYLVKILDQPDKGFSDLVQRLCVREDSGKTLIGTSRAREIALNVVLPFAFARTEISGDKQSSDLILNMFKSAAKTGENHITNQMQEQFGLSRTSLKTACQQQGLLHFYKDKCQDLRCAGCSIASEISR